MWTFSTLLCNDMKLLAFGTVNNPFKIIAPTSRLAQTGGLPGERLVDLLQVFVRLLIVIAALYTFLNLILAGYGFISAGGDPKAVQRAWEKIWQSLVGLLIVAGSFALAVIVGYLIFGSANAMILISPKIYTP
jgi:hypothetical protein